ncbi:MAG: META domain-containing protein [Zoogloeaceae bacterium]|nr:META domain-containing protein [Zoogloeaceae bacterium]
MPAFSRCLFVLSSLFVLACAIAPVRENPETPLEGTRWRLARLEGKSVPRSHAPAHLSLQAGRLTGSGGCNRLMGSYKRDGARLEFSVPAATLMACVGETGQREEAFVRRIPQVRSWAIEGQTLRLGDAEGKIILEMEAESLPPSMP